MALVTPARMGHDLYDIWIRDVWGTRNTEAVQKHDGLQIASCPRGEVAMLDWGRGKSPAVVNFLRHF